LADRARDLRKPAVRIRAGASAGRAARGVMWTNFAEDHSRCYASRIADRLFAEAGIERDAIDFAELYDCFTYSVLVQLEDFGFCPKGEAGAFFRGGHAKLAGTLPVNTHGGLLSEGYIHGLNSVTEAVIQLRGEAGARQVRNAAFGLVTAGGAAHSGSALILGTA
jgi:acetyl-CoA acetyltransferase